MRVSEDERHPTGPGSPPPVGEAVSKASAEDPAPTHAPPRRVVSPTAPGPALDRAGNPETTLTQDAAKVGHAARKAVSPKHLAVDGALAATGLTAVKKVGKPLGEAAKEQSGAGGSASTPNPTSTDPERARPSPSRPAPVRRGASRPNPAPTSASKPSKPSAINARAGAAAGRVGLGGVHQTLATRGEGSQSYAGAARDTARGAKAGAKIGSVIPGAGTAVGAAVGGGIGALKTKRGRRMVIAAILIPPMILWGAVVGFGLMISGGMSASFKANDTAVAVAAAQTAGLDSAEVDTFYEAAAEANVPWEFLAAIAHTHNGPTEVPAAADLATLVEDDEPLGPLGIKYAAAEKASAKYEVPTPAAEDLFDVEDASVYLATLLSKIIAAETDEPSLDAGVELVEDPDEDGQRMALSETDEELIEDAADAEEQFTRALALLPVAAVETGAQGVFATARSWHLGATDSCPTTGAAPAPSAIEGIPQQALEAYTKAGEAFGIDWAIVAGIGYIESKHGSHGRSAIRPDGRVTPEILGPVLDGDGGFADLGGIRAVGPMQFLTSTWASMGKDGNADGRIDAHNIYDAAMGAAFYLKESGAPADYDEAIWAYNHSSAYVASVKAKAEEYRNARTAPAPESDSPTTGDDDGDSTGAARAPALAPTSSTSTSPTSPDVDITDGGLDPDADSERNGGLDASAWRQPLAAGTYTISSAYGMRTHPVTGVYKLHDGTDYAAEGGTPVYAIAAGTVTVEPVGWAGPNYVTVDHGTVDGKPVRSTYAHMNSATVATGTTVQAGQQIGTVGTMGLSTGDHLHLMVYSGDTTVDPAMFLTTAGSPNPTGVASCGMSAFPSPTGDGAWGGHSNGMIPPEQLQELTFSSGALLRPDAADALELLNADFEAEFGRSLGPVGGYRDYAGQVACTAAKGSMCARPGTSNHGWALAADLDGGGINNFGTPEHEWMVEHAPARGWILPPWAQQGGSKPEPWHWQFGLTN